VALLTGGVAILWVHAPDLYASTPVEHGRAQAVALTRTGVLTAGAALLALAGVVANLAESRRANNQTRQRDRLAHDRELASQDEIRRANDLTHARELYARAVDQLGSATLDVRLGGIYALERLARDSPPDQGTVVEVLSAFARVRSTDPALPAPRATPGDTGDWPEPAVTRPTVDVHAAITVLARLPIRDGLPRADLTGANLTGPAALHRLHIPRDGSLAYADLTGADLTDAQMDGADLTGAKLDGANLTRARLVRADLTGVRLDGADLTDAWLHGANLTDEVGLRQKQLDAAHGDGTTVLPAAELYDPDQWLARPESWPPF
jgi:hypothetical protein